MKKILFPVLMLAAFITACTHDDDPTPGKRTDIRSIYSVGQVVTLDSLEYNDKGQLTRYLEFEVDDEDLTLIAYSVYTYSSGKIQKNAYEVTDGMPGTLCEESSFALDNNGFISSASYVFSAGCIVAGYNVEYSYDDKGRLIKASAKDMSEITFTYTGDDLTGDSSGYTYTPSGVLAQAWWPVELKYVDLQLYWRGLFGKLPKNLPAEWHGNDAGGAEISGSCEYEIEDGHVTGVQLNRSVKIGNTPSVSNFAITLNWKEY